MFIKSDSTRVKVLDEYSSRKILGTGENIMMAEVTFKKGGIGSVHSHADHEQVSYIVKGSFEVTLGSEKKILRQGDSFYSEKNKPHGVLALEDSVILDVFTPVREDFK